MKPITHTHPPPPLIHLDCSQGVNVQRYLGILLSTEKNGSQVPTCSQVLHQRRILKTRLHPVLITKRNHAFYTARMLSCAGCYMGAKAGELLIQVCIPSHLLSSCFPNNLCYLLRTCWMEQEHSHKLVHGLGAG